MSKKKSNYIIYTDGGCAINPGGPGGCAAVIINTETGEYKTLSEGLEWKHVFIIDCVEGICPFKKAKTDADFEEERRLFYVAMTRAKQYLYLCTYEQSGNKSVNPSPYLRSVSQK